MSTLEFVKIVFLSHRVIFGKGSTFSQGSGLGQSPLYKVCLFNFVHNIIYQKLI